MFRRAIGLWSLLWGLLLALSIAAWIASHPGVMIRWSQIHWESATLCVRTRELALAQGRMWAAEAQMRVPIPSANFASSEGAWRQRYPPYQFARADAPISFPTNSFAGLGYTRLSSPRITQRAVMLPLWLVTALLSLPLFRKILHEHIARVRMRQGLCPRCGYDLRGSADRCPECGQIGQPHDLVAPVTMPSRFRQRYGR
jgi:hypothetical protein